MQRVRNSRTPAAAVMNGRGCAGLALLLAAVLGPLLAVAQTDPKGPITDSEIHRAIERDAPAMIELRHQIHRHPKLSNREFETAKLVAERLRAIGLEVRTGIAHTGVVGILTVEKPGPVAAVRAELDACR